MKLSGFAGVGLAGASLPALRSIELADCRNVSAEGGGSFYQLRSLGLDASSMDLPALPPELLRRAPHLSVVTITARQGSLQPLTSLSFAEGLTSLAISSTDGPPLQDLPAGPYLSRLHELAMTRCGLCRVPPVLSAAKHLRVLDLRYNNNLPILSADVVSTLRHLQQLRQLRLPRWSPSGPGEDDATMSTDVAVRVMRALHLLQPPASWIGDNM